MIILYNTSKISHSLPICSQASSLPEIIGKMAQACEPVLLFGVPLEKGAEKARGTKRPADWGAGEVSNSPRQGAEEDGEGYGSDQSAQATHSPQGAGPARKKGSCGPWKSPDRVPRVLPWARPTRLGELPAVLACLE
jgi:hypothetical protein